MKAYREPVKGDILLRHIWKNQPNECISWWRYNETIDIDSVKQYTTLNGSFRDTYQSFEVRDLYITVNGRFTRNEFVTDGLVIITATPKIVDAQGFVDRRNWRKIAFSTDPDLIAAGLPLPSEDFLNWFVKNPSCEFVEVKKDTYEEISESNFFKKVNYYAIIIPKDEAKTYVMKDGYLIPKEEDVEEETIEEYFLSSMKNVLQFKNDAQAIRFMEKYYEAKKEEEGVYTRKNIINALHSVELKDNKDYSKIYEGMNEWFNELKSK
jgi:hypothetical protein